jgi:hypothetical protein
MGGIVFAISVIQKILMEFAPEITSFRHAKPTKHIALSTKSVFASLDTASSMANVKSQWFVIKILIGMESVAYAMRDLSFTMVTAIGLPILFQFVQQMLFSMESDAFAILVFMKFQDLIASNALMVNFGAVLLAQ